MSFIALLERAREILEQQGRLSMRALERELGIGGDQLEELIEELVDVQRVARREGKILVWETTTPHHRTVTLRQPAAADATVVRKVVTIVFADLIGSTSLHERLDAESARSLMGRYYGALHAVVEAHGGTVVKLLGDGVMAAFGLPRVAEDDAMRAVRAAVGMQQALRALAREQSASVGNLGLRVAVNTGEVVVDAATDDVVGDPINVAARLQDVAQDGDVVIGEATRRLVGTLVTLAPLGPVTLKGRAETVAAYRIVSLERPGGASAVAFVGRDDELRRLAAVYDAAMAAPGARLAVVLGSPGVGKSRLLDEFTGRLAGATVLVAHCEAAGGATFAPLAKALRAVLGVGAGTGGYDLRAAIDAAVPGNEADRGRIAAGIGALLAGTPAAPEETFFVVRRLLTGLAAAQPVVLVLDDLQWAEPLLLDLVEHLVQWSTGVPLLLLAAARPDLRDSRSALAASGRLATDVVMLAGLDAAAATRLAANVIGADALPAAVAGRVLASSEGNPLFLGELVRMLVDDGALKREGDRWTAGVDLAALEIPPTIHALLAARIERLRAEDRLVLERAAIIGRQFSRAAVAHLLPRDAQSDLDARVEALRRSELVEPDTTWFLGEPALRFHHGLIRDAAYRRVLKGTRAELHARVADWIESRVEEAVEHDETIGWHLEQAHRHLSELGPLDAQGRALGDRASRYLAAAGRRALGRDDLPPAGSLLGRALSCLDAADAARADLALDWCEALLEAGDVGPAAQALDELGRFTADSVRLRAWHTCFVAQRAVLTDPQTLQGTVAAVATAADELAAVGDGAGEAKAHAVHARALARLGQIGACEAALDKALAAARRANDRRRSNAVLAGAPLAALWGPSPVTRASGRCLDVVRVLRITQGAPAVEAVALRCQAVLEALRGRAEAARRMIASSRHMIEELGITHQLLETDVFTGLIDLLEGDPAAAERGLRGAYEGLRSHGLGIDAARAGAFLGRALLIQGRAAEAESLSRESEVLAGDDLEAAIRWRGVRAEALARRGETAAAIECARAAVDLAAATDALLHHADARRALAAALRAAGRHDEAAGEEKQAIALWEAKGAAVLAERARRDGARVPPADRGPDAPREPVPRVQSRVPPNAATAHLARLEAAMAARDADALPSLYADELESIDHTTGATYDRRGALTTWQGLLRAQDGRYRHESLATLGGSLGLCRQWVSGAGIGGKKFDVGAFEVEQVLLVEVDAQGQGRRLEVFAADRLGDAVRRLYERYAELLPDGPARTRAAATARSVAAVLGPRPDRDERLLELSRSLFAPDVEATDHRTVGFGSLRGVDAVVRAFRTLRQLSDDFDNRLDDVLDLRSDTLLLRWTTSGTIRASGGAFAQDLCILWVFGADGRAKRWEQFDAAREAEALARFDELTAEPAPVASSRVAKKRDRRVRPNAATANAARVDAAIAAKDVDAFAALWADESEAVAHETGTRWDRQGSLAAWRSMMRTRDPSSRHEPLATLGDSLALCCWSTSASGFAGRTFDVGAYEREEITLVEVDAQGRRRRTEAFAVPRLGDGVARLYERYAELLPDGPERIRAAGAARSIAAFAGPFDVGRFATALAPAVESVDHRILGSWSGHGADAMLQGARALVEIADDVALRDDDVLGLRPGACLLRRTHLGTDRAGGGAYERPYLMLFAFGPDGRFSRFEWFDAERDAEALARFDELTAEPAPVASRGPARFDRRVRANAATAHAARLNATIAARDTDALPDVFADRVEVVHHPTGVTYDRRGLLDSFRWLLRAEDATFREEPLATLGDALALCRQRVSASGAAGGKFDVGAYETERIDVLEIDADGRLCRGEVFATDRLGDAIARLYERYAELLPDGPERIRAAATARSVAVMATVMVPDRCAGVFAPDIESVDHRIFATWSAQGAEAVLQHLRSVLDLSSDYGARDDDVLALRSDAFLVRRSTFGTLRAGGGAFERPYLGLFVFGADGLVTRWEQFDVEREDEALARFDELAGEAVPVVSRAAKRHDRRVRPNAATAIAAQLDAAVAERDAKVFPRLFADEYAVLNHALGVTYDRQGELFSYRALVSARDSTHRSEPLATLGDSLALLCRSMSASGFVGRTFDVGAYEREAIVLVEVDGEGRHRRGELFAPDRLGDAVVRLYERYAEMLPDGPERRRIAAIARSVTAQVGPLDLDRFVSAVAPAVEWVDRRRLIGLGSMHGVREVRDVLRTLFEVADDMTNRVDDVLDLRSNALLLGMTNVGTEAVGGGTYERPFVALFVYGTDGLVTHFEQFDVGDEAAALARFDELMAARAAARPRRRRVRPNAASHYAARLNAAMAARDGDALPTLIADEFEGDEHTTGGRYDREGLLFSLRSLLRARDPVLRHELLATLGDVLALCRTSSSASGLTSAKFDVAAYERQAIDLMEVDAEGRLCRGQVFAADRLGDAVARLYERYAALLPDGPERTRIAATARAVAALAGPLDVDRMAAAYAPDIEGVDRRRLVSFGHLRGAEAALALLHTLTETADVVNRTDDVLALRSDALLIRLTNSGIDRASGGAFERQLLLLWVFGADGLVTRVESLDEDREAEAFARLDALVPGAAERALSEPPSMRPSRRVRPNAATANNARIDAAVAARDADALPALFAEAGEFVEHMTRASYGRDGVLQSLRSFLRARDPVLRHEPLATLGDALALSRMSYSASGLAGATFDVGAYDTELFDVVEVDAEGRQSRQESFALDRLGDAVVRLFERYAELLPDGPERTRAAATARAVAASVGPEDLDRFAAMLAPDIDYVDHRMIIGMESTRGAEATLRMFRSLHDVAGDVANRVDDVLALRPDAGLFRVTNFGTDRAGGGTYERPFLALTVFGADGLLTRFEQFDADRVAEALARFDELTAEPAAQFADRASPADRAAPPVRRRVRANAATAYIARETAAIAARDVGALTALVADQSEFIDHPTGVVYDRHGVLGTWRALLKAEHPTLTHELLATLGDALALSRVSTFASGFVGRKFDVGAYGKVEIILYEVDAQGRLRGYEVFALDRLGDAVVRLYERHADLLPNGPERTRARVTARSVAATVGPWDLERYAAGIVPVLEVVDHRTLGTWSARGADAYLAHLRSMLELVDDPVVRIDEILVLQPDALLTRRTHSGTDRTGGGSYERPFISLMTFGSDGLNKTCEFFDADRDAEALARCDEVRTASHTVQFENAATRWSNRFNDAWEARDWERIAAGYAPGLRVADRRKMVRLELDRRGHLDSLRLMFEMGSSGFTRTVLATRGDRLALQRQSFEGSDRNVGPSEIEFLLVSEVDDHGDAVAFVVFDPDDLDAAYAELDDRYAAGEAAAFRHAKALGAFTRAIASRDLDAMASTLAPDFVVHDHTPLGWGRLDRPAYVESLNALAALAPDSRIRTDHLWLSARGALGIHLVLGTHEGGAYEQPRVTVSVFDAEGRARRRDIYTLDQLDEARARFAALGASTAPDPLAALAQPNAASAAGDRWFAAFAARDWAAMRALCAPDATFEDRRRLVRISGDIEWWIADAQRTASMRNIRFERHLVSIAGDRVAVHRILLTGDPGGAVATSATESRRISSLGPFEIEFLSLAEVDQSGQLIAGVRFDVDDWRAASREACARWFARDAVAAAAVGPVFECIEAFNDRDQIRVRAVLADDHVVDDRRPARLGMIEGADAWVASYAAEWELAPDGQIAFVGTLAHARYGSVNLVRRFGTFRGGAFETPSVSVSIVADGRIARLEIFEPERVEAALARFAELRPDPLRIPPNAATRATDQYEQCMAARDLDALRRLYAPAMVFDDRRPLIRTTGDREMFIANCQVIASSGAQPSRTLLATAGDRLALERFLWTGAHKGAPFETDTLTLIEVDAGGSCVAAIIFDPDDRRAAAREMFERAARSDAARLVPAAFWEFARGLLDRDLVRCRAALPDDFVSHDHRRTGYGRVERADDYVRWFAALFEESPDAINEPLYTVAGGRRGLLSVMRLFGTLAEGGAFESVYVFLAQFQGDRFIGTELFELEELDVARARFEELRPDPRKPGRKRGSTEPMVR